MCNDIAGQYGWPEPDGSIEPPGPFTLETYLQYMMKVDSWGDANVINILSLHWQAKISVVNACWGMIRETRFRHMTCPLEKCDFVLIYNGATHYSLARK